MIMLSIPLQIFSFSRFDGQGVRSFVNVDDRRVCRKCMSETDFNLVSMSGSSEGSDDNAMQQMEDDVVAWLEHCRIVERIERDYLSSNKGHRYLFSTSRSGHI